MKHCIAMVHWPNSEKKKFVLFNYANQILRYKYLGNDFLFYYYFKTANVKETYRNTSTTKIL